MNEWEVQQLLKRLAAGDLTAFDRIYEMTFQDVYRTLSLLLVNRGDIEDVMNEVYVGMWLSLPRYDPGRPFRYWLHGLIVRKAQDWRRKAWRRLRLLKRANWAKGTDGWTDDSVLAAETRQEVLTLVRRLPYKLRVVIILRYYHDYTLEEMAELLQIPLGTVKSRHHHALKKLRRQLEERPQGKVASTDDLGTTAT